MGAIDKAELAVAAGLDEAHQLHGEATHGISGVDFDDGFEAAGTVGQAIDERVHSDRAGVTHRGEACFETLDE